MTVIHYLYLPKTFKKLIGAYYTSIRDSYCSEGRTNRGGRSNRGSTVHSSQVLSVFHFTNESTHKAIGILALIDVTFQQSTSIVSNREFAFKVMEEKKRKNSDANGIGLLCVIRYE